MCSAVEKYLSHYNMCPGTRHSVSGLSLLYVMCAHKVLYSVTQRAQCANESSRVSIVVQTTNASISDVATLIEFKLNF